MGWISSNISSIEAVWVSIEGRISSTMGRFQSLLGGGEEEQDNFLDESSGAFSLSPMQVPRSKPQNGVLSFYRYWSLGLFCQVVLIHGSCFLTRSFDFLLLLVLEQKLYGFAGCLLAGLVCMLLVWMRGKKPINLLIWMLAIDFDFDGSVLLYKDLIFKRYAF